jgi:formiminoglutamase
MEEQFLEVYTSDFLNKITRKRKDETKIGELVSTLTNTTSLDFLLKENSSRFVLLGLPEDIGVRANFGRPGAYSAWNTALENIMNIQSNCFFNGENLLVLGHVQFDDLYEKSKHLNAKNKQDLEELRALTALVDQRVYNTAKKVFDAGKILIAIGGGHNNSYPLLKAFAGKDGINCINIDPHSDFRPLEGRHSGNGFSYAKENGYLNKYFVLGLHENYNSSYILNRFKNEKDLDFVSYEQISIRGEITLEEAVDRSIAFCLGKKIGLEVDLDSIQNIPSSAKTSSGFLPYEVRKAIHKIASSKMCNYFHIAEGAPVLSHIKTDNKTGKLIAYLVSDFVKAVK